ncbi:MAG: hypothetical protein AB4057_16880 [Crocosphaera sp.]
MILVIWFALVFLRTYDQDEKAICFLWTLICLQLAVFSYFGTNSISFFWDLDNSLNSIHFEYDLEKGKYSLENQIREAKTVLKNSQENLSEELKPLYRKYENEYEDYYRTLLKDLPRIGINDHEGLLRNCDRYIKSCNLLQRTAILKHSLEWLDSKISKVNYRISTLDQNLWLLQKKSELGEIASREEQDKVNELIVSTKYVLEEQITPAEDQDISKLEKKIFEKIINSRY